MFVVRIQKSEFPETSVPVDIFLNVLLTFADLCFLLRSIIRHQDQAAWKPFIVVMYTTGSDECNVGKTK